MDAKRPEDGDPEIPEQDRQGGQPALGRRGKAGTLPRQKRQSPPDQGHDGHADQLQDLGHPG